MDMREFERIRGFSVTAMRELNNLMSDHPNAVVRIIVNKEQAMKNARWYSLDIRDVAWYEIVYGFECEYLDNNIQFSKDENQWLRKAIHDGVQERFPDIGAVDLYSRVETEMDKLVWHDVIVLLCCPRSIRNAAFEIG